MKIVTFAFLDVVPDAGDVAEVVGCGRCDFFCGCWKAAGGDGGRVSFTLCPPDVTVFARLDGGFVVGLGTGGERTGIWFVGFGTGGVPKGIGFGTAGVCAFDIDED